MDLTRLSEKAIELLRDPKFQQAVRYLAGPPISEDDLETLVGSSISLTRLKADPGLARAIVDTVMQGLDRRRFPWLSPDEAREPTETERSGAVLASAALLATRRVETKRRGEGKKAQEDRVKAALVAAGFREVPARRVTTLEEAPGAGEFCGESVLGTRKADLLVRLWDRRVMPIECKVSNSALNSIKRLNNDAAVKAEVWRRDFGQGPVVPTAVLGGVFALSSLEEAQRRGLMLFWSHSLDKMLAWIESTRGK